MSIPAAYIGVIIIWATTPLAIKWSGEGPGFLFGVTSRMVLGAVLCLMLLWVVRIPLPKHRLAWRTYIAAGLGIYGAMSCVYWGSQYISSGLVSVLFGLTPIFTGVMASLWLNERSLTTTKIIGMMLGVVGLWQIFGSGIELGANAGLGLASVLLAAVLHSASSVWVKQINAGLPALAVTAGGLWIALPMYLLSWLIFDGQWPQQLPDRALMSILYLGVIGSVLGFVLFYYVLKHIEAGKVALIALLTPILALLLGHWLNEEAVDSWLWMGTGMILLGLAFYQWGELVLRKISRS